MRELHSSATESGPVAGSSEHKNKPECAIKYVESVDQLSNHKSLKRTLLNGVSSRNEHLIW